MPSQALVHALLNNLRAPYNKRLLIDGLIGIYETVMLEHVSHELDIGAHEPENPSVPLELPLKLLLLSDSLVDVQRRVPKREPRYVYRAPFRLHATLFLGGLSSKLVDLLPKCQGYLMFRWFAVGHGVEGFDQSQLRLFWGLFLFCVRLPEG